MNLIPRRTVISVEREKCAQAANHFATVLRSGWEAVWNRDPQTVIAELNADPFAPATMQLNAKASEINSLLAEFAAMVEDGDKIYTARAPASMPPNFSFDGAKFIYTAPESAPEIDIPPP